MPDYSQITYSVDDHVATVTLNRPEQLNAFTGTMMREMIDAFDQIDADDDVRAVIVTGAGRAFCADADLSGGGETFDNGGSDEQSSVPGVTRDGGGLLTLRIFECTKPVIAAINGAAVGVGVTMTLPMDIRLASEHAKFGFVFVRRGIVPEACSSWFLPRVVGINQATEWCFTGRLFGAAEAKEGRLVRSVHDADDLLPAARAIAAEIVEHTAPVSVALTRMMLWRMLGADHPMEAHRVDSRGIASRGRSGDAREGVT
ncbi:MAG: crotonase/enoyl-CoA hydratase family protein, partial [Actinobacteria bacterium]|nr:crotonase/enoyl-CoA hydratase family protein [Actinomycetota bacterium]